MMTAVRLAAILLSLFAFRPTCDAESPSKLLIGKWQDRAEPQDAVIEFLKDGAGGITETTPKKTSQALISWKINGVYENACVVDVKFEVSKAKGAKPLPKQAKPFKWLVVFDGENRFIFQGRPNEITVMDRHSPQRKPVAVPTSE